MKQLKRVLCLTAAAMLAIAGMAVGVSAAESPLPDQDRNGDSTIVVHKFGIDASYEATHQANGKEILDSETVVGSMEDEDGETVVLKMKDLAPLMDIAFKLERMVEKLDDDDVIIPVEYEVDSTFPAVELLTDEDGTLTFEDLAFGVYRITELATDAVTQISDPFYVSVPMNNPMNASEWLYDIHVYPKNEIDGPEIEKYLNHVDSKNDTMDLTEKVKWIIKSEIPADVAASKAYVITDELHEALRYDPDGHPLAISYIEADGGAKKTLLADTDYVLTYTKDKTEFPWKDALEIQLTPAGRVKIAAALPTDEPAAELPKLTTEFYTKFDIPEERLLEYLGTGIDNKVTLDYTSSANAVYFAESEAAEVHSGGVRLKKVDPSGAVLGGAKFKIYRSRAAALADSNAIKDPANPTQDWVVTSDADTGLAEFLGLAYGEKGSAAEEGEAHDDADAKTTYWIVEIEAPVDEDGKPYNLLKQPLEVIVDATSHDNTNLINVINSNFTLPFTGGAGTLLTTAIGLALLGIGLCIFMVSRKKRKCSQQ